MENKIYLIGKDEKNMYEMFASKSAALYTFALSGLTEAVMGEWIPEINISEINNFMRMLSDREREEINEIVKPIFIDWLIANPDHIRYFGRVDNTKKYNLTVYQNTYKLREELRKNRSGLE